MAEDDQITGAVPVRGMATPTRFYPDGSPASAPNARRTRRGPWSPVIAIGAVVAVSSILVAGQAGGAAATPRWMQPATASASASPTAGADGPSADVSATPSSATPPGAAAADGASTGPDVDVPTSLPGGGLGGAASAPPATPVDATTNATATPEQPSDAGVVNGAGDGGSNSGANRPIPAGPQEVAPAAPAPPWAASVATTGAGFVTTDLGCAGGTSAAALDRFFTGRVGPVIGMDYQHVYPLGGSRYLWVLQDTFVDQPGAATRLGQASFAHNTAMVQDGACFTLFTRGTPNRPASFEPGTGESVLSNWFWPMGGALVDGQLRVFWAEMRKDAGNPGAGDGLGWHPARTWLATYDPRTLARLDFRLAPNSGASPIYGYAVDSDAEYTYLFGNTFEQNLDREGGYGNGPHSGTKMFLARVPVGQLDSAPVYYAPDGWTADPAQAQPISQRYWVENPMQPRYLNGQWVAATKVDGYWGEQLAIDVANHPWGPWTTTEVRGLAPRGDSSVMNTYHAHMLPWLDGSGRVIVSYSQNARNMLRDAWPHPERYRPAFTTAALAAPPPDATSDTAAEPSTSTTTSTTTSTADEISSTIDESTVIATTTLPTTSSGDSLPGSTVPDSSDPTTTTTTTTTPAPTTTGASTTAPSVTSAPPCGTSSTSSTADSTTSTTADSTSSTSTTICTP